MVQAPRRDVDFSMPKLNRAILYHEAATTIGLCGLCAGVNCGNRAATMKPSTPQTLLGAFQGLRISSGTPLRPLAASRFPNPPPQRQARVRMFSSTSPAAGSWLEPQVAKKKKQMKGRPRVPTGGSHKGTTVVWGDYGLRMRDHHRRISAAQLKVAEDTIKQRLRGEKYRLYKRVNCNIGVFVSGNEVSWHVSRACWLRC